LAVFAFYFEAEGFAGADAFHGGEAGFFAHVDADLAELVAQDEGGVCGGAGARLVDRVDRRGREFLADVRVDLVNLVGDSELRHRDPFSDGLPVTCHSA
jgi:hypothetical protein